MAQLDRASRPTCREGWGFASYPPRRYATSLRHVATQVGKVVPALLNTLDAVAARLLVRYAGYTQESRGQPSI